MAESVCNKCGVRVVWCVTETGKRMPVDPLPVDNGNVRIVMRDGQRTAVVLGRGDVRVDPLYVAHFVTCGAAKQAVKQAENPITAVRRVRDEVEAERRGTQQTLGTQDTAETVDDTAGEKSTTQEPDQGAPVEGFTGVASRQTHRPSS